MRRTMNLFIEKLNKTKRYKIKTDMDFFLLARFVFCIIEFQDLLMSWRKRTARNAEWNSQGLLG